LPLRFLENHDRPRARRLFNSVNALKLWTAFLYFQKGAVLIYGGQEAQDTNTPSLFNIDKVNWNGMEEDFIEYLTKLGELKKMEYFKSGNYTIHDTKDTGCIFASYEYDNRMLVGIFNVEDHEEKINTGLKDGKYKSLIGDDCVEVIGGEIVLGSNPMIFEIK
jgi:glycosidase